MSTKPDMLADDGHVAEASGPGGAGELGAVEIRRAIRDHYPLLQTCYALGLGRHPTLRGRVTFRFAIEKDGVISSLTVADNELRDCSVVHCLREQMARVTFPPASSVMKVQYPINFEPETEE